MTRLVTPCCHSDYYQTGRDCVCKACGAKGFDYSLVPEAQLFIDLDGVLAEFDLYYAQHFGVVPDKIIEPPNFWENIKAHGSFYRNLPIKSDALELWEGALKLHPNPIIMTGIPKSVPEASDHKRAWVKEHISPWATVICCLSKHKRLYGKPGDILVDDWLRYRALWEEMGGHFVLHTSAVTSLARVEELLA